MVTPAPTAAAVPTTPPVGGTIDICALLSPADLQTATGKDYLSGLLDPYGQCVWDGNQVGGANGGATIVGAIQTADLAFIKSSFGTGGVDTTVSGHAAFWNPTGGLASLWVDIGGGRLFVLSFPSSSDLDPSFKGIAEKLAEIIVGKI